MYSAILGWRIAEAEKATSLASIPISIAHGEPERSEDGSVTATAEFTSVFAASEDYLASTGLTWNDDWFFRDSAEYNNGLAQAAAVLSAVANAESKHYMLSAERPDYMVGLLSQLGFETANTMSYRYRSAVIDQVAEAIKPGGGNITAYTIASKHITDSTTGEKRLLVVAVARGTFGPEWISNLRAGILEGRSGAKSDAGGDHAGFAVAADAMKEDILAYLDNLRAGEAAADESPSEVSLLLCGHSRGGAMANLVAASLDGDVADEGGDAADGTLTRSSIYAYALATPAVTRSGDARSETYDNIFNIINPADLIPQTPLSSWGYLRYGRDLWLPGGTGADVEESFAEVRRRFLDIEGRETGADPADAEDVARIVAGIGEAASSIEEFSTLKGVLASYEAVTSGHDVGRIMESHAPELYLCWLRTVEPAKGTVPFAGPTQ